jgi:hypothetical protein
VCSSDLVPIKKLLDRKWEKEPNSEESVHGHSSIILKKLIILKKDFQKKTLPGRVYCVLIEK